MASSKTSCSFTDEEVSQLASCDDLATTKPNFSISIYSREFSTNQKAWTFLLPAVFNAQTTLGTSTDYGASVRNGQRLRTDWILAHIRHIKKQKISNKKIVLSNNSSVQGKGTNHNSNIH